MIDSLTIHRFKCFKSVDLKKLRRFNIIVGRNAGGKTALLESLFILAGQTAQLPLQVRAFRGMGNSLEVAAERKAFATLWRDLFHHFDEDGQVELRATGSDNNSRELTIEREQKKTLTQPLGQSVTEPIELETQMVFRWRDAKGNEQESRPQITPKGLDFGPVVESFPCIFLTPVWRELPQHNGQRFSNLAKIQNGERKVVDAMKRDFPFIEDLSVLYSGPTAMVHAAIRSLPEKVPVPLISDGVNKVLSIYLALHSFSGGVVLIDEIENGLYFDIHKNVSHSMLKFAMENRIQIFATTHSMEYLKSLLPVVEAHPNEFCLLRTTKDNGSSDIDQFDGKHLRASLEQHFEVR